MYWAIIILKPFPNKINHTAALSSVGPAGIFSDRNRGPPVVGLQGGRSWKMFQNFLKNRRKTTTFKQIFLYLLIFNGNFPICSKSFETLLDFLLNFGQNSEISRSEWCT